MGSLADDPDPAVSVVIPTFNRSELVLAAVDSALGQTFDNLEVIVVDDGSSDQTLDMLAGYGDHRLRVLSVEHSGIPGRVRNMGLAVARGEFVAFLDSDDVWLPEKVERQLAILLENQKVGLVSSNARVVTNAGSELDRLYLDAGLEVGSPTIEELLRVNFVVNSSVIARRSLIEQAGRFSESPQLRAVEDYDLWLRIAALSDVVYLPEALLLYRDHEAGVRNDVDRCDHWKALIAVMAGFAAFVGDNDVGIKPQVRRRRAELFVSLAVTERVDVGRLAALRSLGSALAADPRATASIVLRSSVGSGWHS